VRRIVNTWHSLLWLRCAVRVARAALVFDYMFLLAEGMSNR
jgi:hypothetical protein